MVSQMTFATMMKEIREAEGMSIYKVHKLSGLPDGYLYKVERGEVTPSFDKCSLIMQAMGYNLKPVKNER